VDDQCSTIGNTHPEIQTEIMAHASRAKCVHRGYGRIMLRINSGGLAVIAVKTQVALGIMHENQYSIFILFAAVGFGKRFIPAILTRVAAEKKP
jgi:hypothetical protein